MTAYICSLCGCEADSKCLVTRSLFIRDDMVAMVRINLDQKHRELPVKEFARECHRLAKSYPEAFVKATCEHHWTLLSDRCEMGCCTREDLV